MGGGRVSQTQVPTYTDGKLSLYDLVDVPDQDNPDSPWRVLRGRGIGDIFFRDIGVYDRTRLTFDQAGMEITYKLRIPRWDGITSNCACSVSGKVYKVFNVAQVFNRDGYPETELTLVTPPTAYEVES